MSESNNIIKSCDMCKNKQFNIPLTEIVSFDCIHNICKNCIIDKDCAKCANFKDFQNEILNLIPDFTNIKERHLF